MGTFILFIKLIVTVSTGSVLYYFLAILKKVGTTSVEEMNESELVISDQGILEENFPEELVLEKEAKLLTSFSRLLFLLLGSMLWTFISLTVGCIAYMIQPSDLMKLLLYFLIYFFCLRLSFGIVNKTIEKSYDMKLMPDKLVFAFLMILFYMIGINYFENVPYFIKWHLL